MIALVSGLWAILLVPEALVVGQGHASASAPVKGAIGFRLDTISADVSVVFGAAKQVTITVNDAEVSDVKLLARGDDRMEAAFDGRGQLREGHVKIELPQGSSLEVKTVSGELSSRGGGGDVRFHSLSGDADIASAGNVDLQSVSGDFKLGFVGGNVRVKTVSGDVQIGAQAGGAPQLEWSSTSGDLTWSGLCGAKCRLSASTVSGDVRLGIDVKSSFDLKFQSHSGEIESDLGLPRTGGGRYGKGEGTIEVRSFSGDLTVRKR
jgi:hypothetical protein